MTIIFICVFQLHILRKDMAKKADFFSKFQSFISQFFNGMTIIIIVILLNYLGIKHTTNAKLQHSVNHQASISQSVLAFFCIKVVIGSRDPVTSTRTHKSQYLATFKLYNKKFISTDIFYLPNLTVSNSLPTLLHSPWLQKKYDKYIKKTPNTLLSVNG